jgi:plastocyanin
MAGIAAAPAATGADKAKEKVKVVDFEFVSSSVKIRKGDKVTWVFKEGKHNVTGKGWKSGTKTDGKYSHVFKKAGTYKYRCTIHQPDMDGVVKVVK